MSLDLIAKLSRADLLSVAADLSDDALKTALRAVVNVSASTVAPAAVEAPAPAAAPVASTKAKKKSKTEAATSAAAPATPPAAGPEEAAIAFAIAELGKVGFARADLAQATGIDPDAPRLKRAIDRAVEAGSLVKAGEKRFTRYGATKAIAEAAKK
jgi:hypothetical protein